MSEFFFFPRLYSAKKKTKKKKFSRFIFIMHTSPLTSLWCCDTGTQAGDIISRFPWIEEVSLRSSTLVTHTHRHTAWMCMDCGAVRDPGGTAQLRTVSLASDPGCMALHALRERRRRRTHTGVLKEPRSGRLFIFPDLPSARTLASSLAALRGLPPASTPNPLTPLFRPSIRGGEWLGLSGPPGFTTFTFQPASS